MRPAHDVVIVGGGPAGLSAALFATHLDPSLRGRLVVLERARYPREKICAGGIGGRADRALARIGVRVEVPSVEAAGFSVQMTDERLERRHSADHTIGRVVRRAEFDAELARIARDRGIVVRQGVKVTGLSVDPSRAVVHTSDGDLTTKVVIGADGVGSVIRKEIGASSGTWRAQVLEVDTEACEGDPPRDLLHFDISDTSFAGYAWDFPTVVDGHQLVCRGVYQLQVPGGPAPAIDVVERLATRMRARGLDLEGCRKKRFAERGFAPHEPCARPRVILIGEAAGIDPITGEGIAQAIEYGQALAPYLVDRLERNTLIFDDWARALASTRLGVDLHLREQIARRFFGESREFYERSLLAIPEFLEAGMQYFAGERVSRSLLWSIATTTLQRAWTHRAQRPWRGLELPLAGRRPSITDRRTS